MQKAARGRLKTGIILGMDTTERPVYGLWNDELKAWMKTSSGAVICSEHKRVLCAYFTSPGLIATNDSGWHIREIGENGFPDVSKS